MKKIIKKLFSFKVLKIKERGKNCFIHPMTTLKNSNNIKFGNNIIVRKGCKISVLGSMKLEENNMINTDCNIFIKSGEFYMAENSYLNNNCTVIGIGNIKINKNVMIGPNCNLISGNHKFIKNGIPYIQQGDSEGTICIEENVWIGANSIILPNVSIKRGAVVAAGAVVTKDIPEYEVWGGNPAKFIKSIKLGGDLDK